MKDEIKEILEKPNVYSFNDECYLYFGDYNKLKNYITNLQEENEKLKELCNKYEEEHNNEFQCWKRDRKELLDKRAKIDKAIEYIKNDWYELNTRDIEHCINLNKDIRIDLLNILKGENNDI